MIGWSLSQAGAPEMGISEEGASSLLHGTALTDNTISPRLIPLSKHSVPLLGVAAMAAEVLMPCVEITVASVFGGALHPQTCAHPLARTDVLSTECLLTGGRPLNLTDGLNFTWKAL